MTTRMIGRRRKRGKHGLRYRLVDLHCSDAEAVDTASICDRIPRAVIAGRSCTTSVVGAQLASAMSAYRETLQQSSSLSHGTAA